MILMYLAHCRSAARESFLFPLLLASLMVSGLAMAMPTAGNAQPAFSKSFDLPTIGPGSSVALVFTIDNSGSGTPAADLAFTDVLPAGVVIAGAPNVQSSCGGAVSAPPGASAISLAGGMLGAGAQCNISVVVTAAAAGMYTNTSGDLTSSLGNSGTAMDDLEVVTSRPGLSKSFSPNVIPFSGRSTLTFDIDYSAGGGNVFNISVTDALPTGMVVATPSNVVNTCTIGSLTVEDGATTVSFFSGFLMAGQSCSFSFDVEVPGGAGIYDNVSFVGGSTAGNLGVAADRLTVQTLDPLGLVKNFAETKVYPGQLVDLEFVIINQNRLNSALDITFTDDLDAALTGLVAEGLPLNDVCGPGSQISGTSTLTLTGGNVPPEGTCMFTVPVRVPVGAAPGEYTNVTSTISADVGGSTEVGSAAAALLVVENEPILTKTFLTNPGESGGVVDVEFTITNSSAGSAASDLFFQDIFDSFIPLTTLVASLTDPCGVGSSVTQVGTVDGPALQLSGGSLAATASCTFTAQFQLPEGVPPGDYINETGSITATVDGITVSGNPAMDTLTIAAAPLFTKTFLPETVIPGQTTDLTFVLSYSPNALVPATDLSFTDDLDAFLTGATAVGLPLNDVCGVGSQISGTSTLTFTGGSLLPGESCSITVTVQTPAAAALGTYTNNSSVLSATVGAFSLTSPASTADLTLSNLAFSKRFVADRSIPGGTVNLEFTIENLSSASTASGITFTDNLSAVLSGLTSDGATRTDVCGVGSQISGTNFLMFVGGSLAPSASCTFSVPVTVPAGAAIGTYTNITSNISYNFGGPPIVGPPTIAPLEVFTPITFSKEFTDDPVLPGAAVTLEFTIVNESATEALTTLTFTDDLDAALSGLAATGLPINDVCGVGSQISGSGLLTLTGGSLPAGGSCTFSVSVVVPAGASLGTDVINTTSSITGVAAGSPQTGAPASDTLRVIFVQLSKAFSGVALAGGNVTLTFTLENLSGSSSISNLSFSDDLSAVLPGLVAVGLPQSGVCGGSSNLSGTSFLTFTGGELAPGETCSVVVDLDVPAGATPGTYTNVTSDVTSSGLLAAVSAAADLDVAGPPVFSKAFTPSVIGAGDTSTLTFTIDNSVNAIAASSLDFTDVLPVILLPNNAVVVAGAPNPSTTCTGGTIDAIAGSGTIGYTGGTVAANATCTVSVDVTAAGGGDYLNTTGALTSSSGDSGTAAANLSVLEPLEFSKSFTTDPVLPGGAVSLEYVISNPSTFATVSAITFTDDLDAVLTSLAATGLPANDVCGAGSMISGTSVVTLSGGILAPGGTCTITVPLSLPSAAAAGAYPSTSSTLVGTGLGIPVGGPAATATLNVSLMGFTKAFSPSTAVVGDAVTLTFTLTNPDPVNDATFTEFSDDLDATLSGLMATGLPLADVCGVGSSVTGTSLIVFSDGVVPAGGVCTFDVTVQVPLGAAPGVYLNVTSDVLGIAVTSRGGATLATAASANLEVLVPPPFTKAFAPTDIPAMGVSTLTLSIDNTANSQAATALDFTDNLPTDLVVASPANASTTCTGGTLTATVGSGTVNYTGGTVAAGASCSVSVDVTTDLPGLYSNTTGDLTSSSGNSGTASADLGVLGTVNLTKILTAAPVLPGGAVTVEYTLTNPSPFATLTDITFSDNLGAALAGLAATGLPANNVCGAGSTLSGTTTVTLTGGTLAPGASCVIAASLTVPVDAPVGTYPGATSGVTADGNGVPVTGASATADLVVDLPTFVKSFAPDEVGLGEVATLTFTLTNPDPVNDATAVSFIDDLEAVIPGLEAISTPLADICGVGSSVTGTSVVTFADGVIPAGGFCTFDVDVQMPSTVGSFGTFTNFTSTLTALVNGNAVDFGPATVASAEITLTGSPVEIPTASQWGLILLGLLLTAAGLRRLRMG